jgi:acyl-CoA synthetase (AMP-forming)/AMP-acid ligase II
MGRPISAALASVSLAVGRPLTDDRVVAGSPMTIGAHVDAMGRRFVGRDALVTTQGRWRYEELTHHIVTAAAGLLDWGVGAGTRVAVLMPNSADWVAATYGTAMIGGVAVMLNVFSSVAEQTEALASSDVRLLVAVDRFGQRDVLAPFLAEHPELTRGERTPAIPSLEAVVRVGRNGPGVFDPGVVAWSDVLTSGRQVGSRAVWERADLVRSEDDALVMFTSGTSGQPKAILHAHRSPCIQQRNWATFQHLREGDRVFSTYPWCWSSGLVRSLGACLSTGACLVTMDHFEPAGALELMARERVDTVITPGQGHLDYRLIEDPGFATTDLSSVRRVTNKPLGEALGLNQQWLGAAYGMSESCTLITVTPQAPGSPGGGPAGNSGTPLPGWRVKIVDRETGTAVPRGTVGQVRIAGPTMMTAYNGRPLAEVVDEEGFFPTSDLGHLDQDDYFFFSSRADDIVRSGGVNVSTTELELTLATFERVKHAVALGLPHPRLGQALVAVVVPSDDDLTPPEVLDWLRPRLATYKLPRLVLLSDESALTFTLSQKIQRVPLRDAVQARIEAEGLWER